MKRMSRELATVSLLAAALVLTGCATSTPFAGAAEPHAMIYLNGTPRANGLYPVRVVAVDGRLTSRDNTPTLRFKPGYYTLKLRPVNIHHMENLPGMTAGHSSKQTQVTLPIRLRPGKAYYIGAKIRANGNWHPVVWKVTQGDGQ